MYLWADIENPPQVQYLVPLVRASREQGSRVVVTARDYGDTLKLLEGRGERFHAVGESYGASRLSKVRGLGRRTRALTSFVQHAGVPDALVSASRAATLAARRLGVAPYVISDYEYVDMSVFRLSRSTVLFPDVIDPGAYRRKGISSDRLLPFRGLKEDITFSGIDVAAVERARLGGDPSEELVRVLFRPPAEESHYYRRESRSTALAALRFLARPGVVVCFSPRYPWQATYLQGIEWVHEPVVLPPALPFVGLLKAVDLVVCSGGTMLREAAYLGVPAYSIFRSRIGAVDRHLVSLGRATLLRTDCDFGRIRLEKRAGFAPLNLNPGLAREIAAIVADRTRPG